MEPVEFKNIRSLVQSTPLLGPSERGEWMALLESMTDGQLLELKRLLEPSGTAQAAPKGTAPGAFLSHIVNLPSSDPGKPQPAVSAAAPKPVMPVPSARPISFARDLEEALAEKELPPPKAPTTFKPDISVVKQQLQAEPPAAPPPHAKVVFPEILPTPPKPVPQAPPASGPVKISSQKVLEETGTTVPPATEPFRAGLKDTQVFVQAQREKQRQQEQQSEQLSERVANARPDLSVLSAANPLSFKIKGANDVSGLSPRIWKSENHDSLLHALFSAIEDYGYHPVIIALEKSALYQSYINTGIQILQDGSSFEELQEKEGSLDETYLTRREFEEFTDLLRKIQAGN